MALIFLSHSSKDNKIVKNYKKKIEEYGFKSVFLDFDDENGIQINEIWEERLYKELNKTNIMLCFVSKNWIDSCWCQKEYSIAKSLNKEVILLSIEKDSKKQKEVFEWIGKHVQQINIAENPDAFKEVLKQINDLTKKVFDKPYKWDENKNPYPGLKPFTEDMAAVFYGREDETDAVITEMTNPKSLATIHAFLIAGASGMGKSSLLRAGIIPKMKTFEEYNKTWHILPTMRPGKDTLNKILRILINDIFTNTEESNKYYEQIKSDIKNNKKESFEKLIDRLLLKYSDKKILLPIDQAEEFFITSNKEEKKIFFELLSWIFEHYDEFYTIWTIRSDYIEKFQTDTTLKTIRKYSDNYLLSPIKEEHITTIIKYPAYKSDIVLEETLIERIRKDVKDTKALPLLAYTLNELTKKFFDNSYKHKERIVTLKDYLSLAMDGENPIYAIIETKIKEILSHPEKINTSLNKEQLLKKCKDLFIYHLIDIDIDGKASKKIALKNNLSPLLQKIADAFIQERLLISGSIEKEKERLITYEIAHESIIQNWTLLQSWINEEKDFFITRAQVRIALNEWKKSNKNKNALLVGILLEKAQNFIDKPWSEEEKEFISLSTEEKERQEREKAKKEEEKRRLERRMFLGSIGFGVVSFALGGFAFYQRENAITQAKRANLNEKKVKEELEKANYNLGIALVEKAKNAAYNQAIPKAHLFAFAALKKLNKNHKANNSISEVKYIITNYNDRAISSLIGHKKWIISVAYSPDGNAIVSGSADNTIKIWDAKNHNLIVTLKGHKSYVLSVAYSPDGKMIVSGSFDKTIKIWDAKKYKLLATLKGHTDIVYSVAYSPDGKTIVSGSEDNTIKIWDAKNHKLLATLKGHTDSVRSVAYSPDGKTIVSGSEDNTIKIWDAKNHNLISTLKGHEDWVNSVAYSPDGNAIASGSFDNTIKIWDAKKYKLLTTLKYEYPIFSIVYSPDGKMIASGSFDKIISIWDIKNHNLIITLKGHKSPIKSVAYSPDGKTIVSGSNDKTIKIWDAKNYNLIATLKGHEDWVNSVAYSPDGKTIISGSSDGTIKVWNLEYIMNKYYKLDNPEYIKQNIKRLEQFLQVKLDGVILKDAIIPPLDIQKT